MSIPSGTGTGTHSTELRVGTRMIPTQIQGANNNSFQTATPATHKSHTASGSSSSSIFSLMNQRFLIGGTSVPKWAVLTTGVLIGGALLYVARNLLRGGKSTAHRPSTRRGTKLSPSSSGGDGRGRGRTPGGMNSSDDIDILTEEEEGVLMMGDEESLTEPEREFRRQCSHFLTQLGNAGDMSGESEPLDPMLERSIRMQLPEALALYNAASRSLAAHLLLAVNAHYLTNSQTEAEFHQLMRAQHRDMLVAWNLLACADESEWETRTLDILRIQVAQCLKDGALMLPLLERMSSHPPSSWNVEENMLLFTVAPLLGRWAATVRFGEHLKRHFPDAGVLQMSSMDYDVLLELARERARTVGDAPIDQLLWRQYQITSQRLRLVDVQSSDPKMIEELESQFTDPETKERSWQALVTTAASEVVRCGAIAQLKSFSPAGVALVGPADSSSMFVRGRFQMHDGRQRQVETYHMHRVTRDEMDSGGVEDTEAEDTAAAVAEAAAQGIDLSHGMDRDDDLAARLKHGGTNLPDEYWKGEYIMIQEEHDPHADEDESHSSGHGHSHGGKSCGHSHGKSAGGTGVATPLASLTVRFELEFVLRPRPSPTDEEPDVGADVHAAAAEGATATSMLGSAYALPNASEEQ
jgi:hypothetical protein